MTKTERKIFYIDIGEIPLRDVTESLDSLILLGTQEALYFEFENKEIKDGIKSN